MKKHAKNLEQAKLFALAISNNCDMCAYIYEVVPYEFYIVIDETEEIFLVDAYHIMTYDHGECTYIDDTHIDI